MEVGITEKETEMPDSAFVSKRRVGSGREEGKEAGRKRETGERLKGSKML